MGTPQRWDIFCTVIDNYGDIAVCWRLARQLVVEHKLAVRLWVDNLAPLAALQPGADASLASQHMAGVDVRRWTSPFPEVEPAEVVIEAFACDLPESYLLAMARCPARPAWINLEYLSAESWVAECHGQVSPHPRLPLTKHFFFPGFDAGTGGLLLEGDYEERRKDFDAGEFRSGLGLPEPSPDELTISLFAYENPALPGLLRAWEKEEYPIRCLVPEGRAVPLIRNHFDSPASCLERGSLRVHIVPFIPQSDYDRLLWLCGLNFVRGEDSFVRAQWAAKPFVWQIYAQPENAHRLKLDAFLDHYLARFAGQEAAVIRAFWLAWNGCGDIAAAWRDFSRVLPGLGDGTRAWREHLAQNVNLAGNLTKFVANILA